MPNDDSPSAKRASLPDRVSVSVDRYGPELKLLLGFIPVAGPALSTYLDDLLTRRAKRLESTLHVFADESGASIADLFESSVQKAGLRSLLTDTLESAQRTADERKLRALGRILAQGYLAGDDAAVDELALMHAAVRDLEAPHLKVLDRLMAEKMSQQGVKDSTLAQLFPNGPVVLYPMLKTLERHGLAGPMTPPSSDPDQTIVWGVWDFGVLLYEKLLGEEVGLASKGDEL